MFDGLKGIICPTCQLDKSHVITTVKIDGMTYRERICIQCKTVFYTVEISEDICEHATKYIKSRKVAGGVKRKRKCRLCHLIYTTFEDIQGVSSYNPRTMKAEIKTTNSEIINIFQFI